MKIKFMSSIILTDQIVARTFVEIMNVILMSKNLGEMNMNLNRHPSSHEYRALTSYFRWHWAEDHFVLYQKIEYNSPLHFKTPLLVILFGDIQANDIDTGDGNQTAKTE